MTVAEFNENFYAIEGLLVGFAMKLTRSKDKAQDLVQETAMRAFNSKEKFNEGTNFKAWITTIMRNSFINHYRKLKVRNKVEKPIEDVLNVAQSAVENEKASSVIMMKELDTIVNSLTDSYKIPFMMFYQGYSYIEISEELELPIGTVKSRIFFARKQLREKVEARYGRNILKTA